MPPGHPATAHFIVSARGVMGVAKAPAEGLWPPGVGENRTGTREQQGARVERQLSELFTKSAGCGGVRISLEQPGGLLLSREGRRSVPRRAGPPTSARASPARPQFQPQIERIDWGASATSPACGTGYGRAPPHVSELRGRYPTIPLREGLLSSSWSPHAPRRTPTLSPVGVLGRLARWVAVIARHRRYCTSPSAAGGDRRAPRPTPPCALPPRGAAT